VIYLPLASEIFKTQALSFLEFDICIGASAFLFHAVALEKWVKGKIVKKNNQL